MTQATPRPILSEEARELARAVRGLLGDLREALAGYGAAEGDLRLLRQAELDLDELFLLVVVGEFNAGKSAFINALVGERVMEEGVTPTTAAITRLRYSDGRYVRRDGALVEVGFPLEWLRDVAVVDTPGTNAVLREHEEITSHFVPRADLVLFVTSADRPFTETERQFMERIRTWGKKVVVVLNKADLLTDDERAAQVQFVRDNVQRLLGFTPEVFPVSARQALAAKNEADPERRPGVWESSRFGALEAFVRGALEERSRLSLKLSTPLGVAERVGRGYLMAAEEKLALLGDDRRLVESIDAQVQVYQQDMRRDVAARLEGVDNILLELRARGVHYLDDTHRLSRVFDLFRQKQVEEEFERVVVADTGQQIDRAVQDIADWMVDQDVRLWESVTDQVESRRRAALPGSAAERLPGTFEVDRRALLGTLGGTAREVVQQHDHRREAESVARSARDAVTQTTLLEAGALGLGAATAAIAGSSAALAVDITGILATTMLAGLGLWVIPRRRRQAIDQFRTRSDELRARLRRALEDNFGRELERGTRRVQDSLAPYSRFVRTETDRTTRFRDTLQSHLDALTALRGRVEQLARPVGH